MAEFIVSFYSDEYAVQLPKHLAGTDAIEGLIELGFKLSEIDNQVRFLDILTVNVNVSFERAQQTGAFKERGKLQVKVPWKGLNRFARLHPVWQDNKWHFEWHVDKGAILDAWEEAGCPLEWDPGKEAEA